MVVSYHIEELGLRNNQRFSPDFLVDRWEKLEGDAKQANDIGRQTAMRALRRNPWNILILGLKTYLAFWDVSSWKKWATLDLGHGLEEQQIYQLAIRFHHAAEPSGEQRPTILQTYFLNSYPYCLLVLTAPALACAALLLRKTRTYCALIFLHASITLAVVTIFTVNPSVRYVQPVSLLTLLIFAIYANALFGRRTGQGSVDKPIALSKKEPA